jgi:hypothetical protein
MLIQETLQIESRRHENIILKNMLIFYMKSRDYIIYLRFQVAFGAYVFIGTKGRYR